MASTQDIARYMHASLEWFDRAAAQEIIRRFEVAAAAVGAEPGRHSLKYDEHDHVFFLVCQNHVGAALDEKLGHIIRDYVANGDAGAARFAECELADPFDDYDVQPDEGDTLPPPPSDPTIHLVNFDGINSYGKAKAFRLRDLPPVLRNRADSRHNNISHLANVIAFRRARWDEPSEQHLFDASVGHELPELSAEEQDDLTWLFELSAFEDFTAKVTIPGSQGSRIRYRVTKPVGEESTLDQWFEGTGAIGQDDPDAEPEMKGDARRFASGPSLQPNPLGRVRQPMGMTLSELQEPEMEEEPDKSEAQMNNTFAALMKPGADSDSDSDTESSKSTDEASMLKNIKPANIADMVKREPGVSPSGGWSSSSKMVGTDNNSGTALTPTSAERKRSRAVPHGALSVGPGVHHSDDRFPKWDRSYASVDGIGLRGDAINQVNWEIENAPKQHSVRNRSGVQTYESLASSRAASVSMSIAAGRDANVKPAVSKTPMTRRETVFGGDEPWANKVVAPETSVPTGTLIDMDESASIHGSGRPKAPKFPPGSFPPLGPKEPIQTSPTDESEALIQFDEDEAPIVERLQSQQDRSPRLHNTMKQQASSKKKPYKKPNSSSSKSTPSRAAQLELPSPPPPPKPRREVTPVVPQSQNPSGTDAKSIQSTEPEPPSRLQQAFTYISSLSHPSAEKADVVIQFGLALLTDAADLAANKALRCADLQDQLDGLTAQHRSTSFSVALGRKHKDGVYLLRLPTMLTGSESPFAEPLQLVAAWNNVGLYAIMHKNVYEIVVVVPGGCEWKLIFDQDRPHDAEMMPVDNDQQSVSVHYPLRVWDARIQPKQTSHGSKELDSKLKRNIMTFLKTINTSEKETGTGPPMFEITFEKRTGNEPPIFEATVPDSAFSVTNVLAKRVFTQNLRSGIWTVSQVWDLHVETSREGVVVYAKDEGTMQQFEGRLWWEANLKYEGCRQELGATMNEIAEKLDNVGVDKKRAADMEKQKQQKKNKKQEKPEEPAYEPYW
jgi:hypothetical protein